MKEYRRVVARLLMLKRQGAPIASSVRYLRYLLHWPDYAMPKTQDSRGGMRCWRANSTVMWMPTELCYPCSLLIGERPSKNALEVGFVPAFASRGHVDCRSCDAACFTEYNCLYDLDPSVIWDGWLPCGIRGGTVPDRIDHPSPSAIVVALVLQASALRTS